MSRCPSRTSPVSTTKSKRTSPSPSSSLTESTTTVKERRAALSDLVGAIFVAPPHELFLKPSTARALFDLAVDQLTLHNKTTAEALRRYATVRANLDQLDLIASTEGLPSSAATTAAKIEWLLGPPTCLATDVRNDFDTYRRTIGKQTCHLRTLRRQDELLRAFARAKNYPTGTQIQRPQRQAWCREYLSAMIAEAQHVTCWHQQPDLTPRDMGKILGKVGQETSISKLSALVLEYLHPTTSESILKRLLHRGSSHK